MSRNDSDPAVNPIGEYLRARRALAQPSSLSLRASARRRVSGLTREEVAVAAGMSVEYYTRLEQGKDRRPSPQVVLALSAALRLDPAASAFLADLAADRTRPAGGETPSVPVGVLELLSLWKSTPAFVVGRFGDVLAATPVIAELTPACRPGGNMFREIFLASESRRRYVNWDAFTAVLVAGLRSEVGRDIDEPQLLALLSELESGSPRFRELWRRHDVSPPAGGITVIRHPLIGRVSLRVQTLSIPSSDLSLVIYHAAADSPEYAAILALSK